MTLKAERTPDFIQIQIEDDDPGAPPEALTRLSDRGVRLDESNEGHGLGLAIVQDIVAQYSGEIDFGKSENLGGFQVRVKFRSRHQGGFKHAHKDSKKA